MKHLRNLPDDVLDQMAAAHASNERDSGAPSTNGSPSQQQRSRPPTHPPTRQSPLAKSPPQPSRPLSRGERETSPDFDDDDDALLEEWVKAKVGSGERWNNISIYQELSKKVRAISLLLAQASAILYLRYIPNSIPAISSLRQILEESFCNLVERRTYRHEELELRARACFSPSRFATLKERWATCAK